MDTSIKYKIILLGDSGVGKTFLVSRFTKDSIPRTQNPTIGVEFSAKTETLKDGSSVKAQIWDTAGQERYKAIASTKALGALVVYDITKESTFASIPQWLDDLRSNAETDPKILLVGNKVDEVKKDPSKRRVKMEEAAQFARNNRLLFTETSALEGENVQEAFLELLEAVHHGKSNNQFKEKTDLLTISKIHNSREKDSSTCSC